MAERVGNSFPPTNPLLQPGQHRGHRTQPMVAHGPGGKRPGLFPTPAASSLAQCPRMVGRPCWSGTWLASRPSALPPAVA